MTTLSKGFGNGSGDGDGDGYGYGYGYGGGYGYGDGDGDSSGGGYGGGYGDGFGDGYGDGDGDGDGYGSGATAPATAPATATATAPAEAEAMSDYSEICRQLRLKPCLCQPVNRTCIKCKAAEALEALQARLDAAYAAMRTDWRDLVQENDALRAKLEALEAHKAAKAAIDLELGMPEDGCNNTQATLTAIRLLHSAHRDDVGANNRLVAFLSESVRMIEGYMRAGWLTNPAAREQATDFIQRARLAYSAPPALPENK